MVDVQLLPTLGDLPLMSPTNSDGEITLGELGRRLDRLTVEVQNTLQTSVNKDVYARDVFAWEERFKGIELSMKNMATNRRQAMYALMAICGSCLAALVGALVAGAHP